MGETRLPILSMPLAPATATETTMPESDQNIFSLNIAVLGGLIVLIDIWVQEQFSQYIEISNQFRFTSIQSPRAADLLRQRTPRRYFWLQPHITSRTRQTFATAVCCLVILLQVLELKWLYRLGWHLSSSGLDLACPCAQNTGAGRHPITTYLGCMATVAALATVWMWLIRKSFGIVFTQLTYVLQLSSLRPDAPLDLRHKWSAA